MVRRRTPRAVGDAAERRAAGFLADRGLHLIESNYRCRVGEIDLVMRDGECLVFVEVRLRAGRRFVPAALTVDRHKQAKLTRAARRYLQQHDPDGRAVCRFDVVAIDGNLAAGDPQAIEWISDAFRPGAAGC